MMWSCAVCGVKHLLTQIIKCTAVWRQMTGKLPRVWLSCNDRFHWSKRKPAMIGVFLFELH